MAMTLQPTKLLAHFQCARHLSQTPELLFIARKKYQQKLQQPFSFMTPGDDTLDHCSHVHEPNCANDFS